MNQCLSEKSWDGNVRLPFSKNVVGDKACDHRNAVCYVSTNKMADFIASVHKIASHIPYKHACLSETSTIKSQRLNNSNNRAVDHGFYRRIPR